MTSFHPPCFSCIIFKTSHSSSIFTLSPAASSSSLSGSHDLPVGAGIKNSTYYTQQVAQAHTETDQEQVGDLDSNIHHSCCQRLCILNQPVCNSECEHTSKAQLQLMQYLLFHHVLFCKCFSYVLLSIPLQLHFSVKNTKHTKYTQ